MDPGLADSGLSGSRRRRRGATTSSEPRAAEPEPRHVDLAHLPPDDPAVYQMLQEADTIGIFQVESRAQMATLPRLRPTCFYDIVVEVAIIRPGPIVGKMVHPYLKRRQGREPVTYPHPSLQPILQRTLGVPLFQEQLLRMAMVAAGFTGGEAEELRRAFGFKRSEKRMAQVEAKLRAGMVRQGITGDAAEQIIRSITSFALYGFPESHAASFALLVYASAYLKAHYPARVLHGDAEQPADGLLSPGDAGQGRAAARRPLPADRRAVVRLGMPRRGRRPRAAGTDVCERTAARRSAERSRRARSRLAGPRVREPIERTRWNCRTCHRSSSVPSAGATTIDARGTPNADDVLQHLRARVGSTCRTWPAANQPVSLEPRAASSGREPRIRGPANRDHGAFTSIEDLIARTGIRRDELATLAEIGALNAFGHDRRGALWQIERAVRPAGELFDGAGRRGRRRRADQPRRSPGSQRLRTASRRCSR